jgi:endogenous inhibitor of DNA gyrase (YacG/DUF329 family)
MTVKCPRCGKNVPYENNPFRPFCSKRCKLIDLGKWVSGEYRITGKADEEETEIPAPDDDPTEK